MIPPQPMIPRRTVAGLLGGEPMNDPERRSGREQGRGLRRPLDERPPGRFGIHPYSPWWQESAREVRTDDRTIHTRGTDRLAAPVQRLFNRSGVSTIPAGCVLGNGVAHASRASPQPWGRPRPLVVRLFPGLSRRPHGPRPLKASIHRPGCALTFHFESGLGVQRSARRSRPGNPWLPDGRSAGRRATDPACARTAALSVWPSRTCARETPRARRASRNSATRREAYLLQLFRRNPDRAVQWNAGTRQQCREQISLISTGVRQETTRITLARKFLTKTMGEAAKPREYERGRYHGHLLAGRPPAVR